MDPQFVRPMSDGLHIEIVIDPRETEEQFLVRMRFVRALVLNGPIVVKDGKVSRSAKTEVA